MIQVNVQTLKNGHHVIVTASIIQIRLNVPYVRWISMPIKYGEDDYPYIKEALRYFIENNLNCHYHYKELFALFKSEPCIICSGVDYKPDKIHREKGKLICGKCWDDINANK